MHRKGLLGAASNIFNCGKYFYLQLGADSLCLVPVGCLALEDGARHVPLPSQLEGGHGDRPLAGLHSLHLLLHPLPHHLPVHPPGDGGGGLAPLGDALHHGLPVLPQSEQGARGDYRRPGLGQNCKIFSLLSSLKYFHLSEISSPVTTA